MNGRKDEMADLPRLVIKLGSQDLLGRAHEVVVELGEKPFAFWYDGKGREAEQYSFRRMWDEAGKIAYMLRGEWGVPKGAMVVLCYGPGLHFFAAFLGCFRAGVVAVMVYPPAPPLSKSLPKMSKIVADCKPLLCLTDSTIAAVRRVDRANPLSDSRKLWPEDLDFKATDGGLLPSFFSSSSDAGRSFDEPSVAEEDLAFLQYTSGSTGDPKGVMVTFGALMANVYLIGCHPATGMCRMWPSDKAGDSSSDQPEASSSGPAERSAPSERLHNVPTTGFSWLPQYHDMGLVLGLLTPFLTGMTMHYMSPVTFIKRPLLWLELVSRHRVEWSVAPDFAYALCARYMAKVRGTRKEPKLDLSSVVTLTSGAEPIRTETVERFEAAFLPFGLRQGWFSAAYGLAEHVVSVSWATVLDRSPSRPDLTSVGSPGDRLDFMDIRIVNPDTRVEVSEAAATGEIWISSPSVAAGYWGKPELSKETFGATLALPRGGAEGSDDSDVSSCKYLRTGDVGFVEEGLLYICGRIKDLIIFNGVNHYPQDVEFAVQEASSAVRQGCIAAFSSDETGGDGVLEVVFEIRQERESEAQAVVEAAQAALSSCLGLRAARVVAVKQKTIPKTTSGKIRRRATRQALHAGELHMVRELTEDTASGQEGRAVAMSQGPPLDDLASTRSTPEDRPRSVEGEVPERRGERESSLAIHSMESLGRQARVAIILEEIIGFAVEVTHNRALTADDRFMEAGMTSVMMAELAVMLEDFLGSERTEEEGDKDFELGAEAFFDYPTPALLAAHVETTLFGEGEGDDASADGLPPPLLSDSGSDIAVIGMACRFPGGCNSPEELWAKLCNEEDCVTDAPSERGLGAGVRGGFIDTVEAFDNAFFGMSIAEAEAQDPNQRIMLEVAYEALHRAGYEGRHRLEGHRVGVFVGAAGSDWSAVLRDSASGRSPNAYTLAGASRACFAGRISHTLGLVGPCESVDAACSSAFVALNNACNSLRLRQCSSAVVGGVNLLLHHQGFGGLASAGLLSKEGSFDVRGDGYVRSEGSGAVVLKLLCEAIKDEDNVLAVIKAAAVNHSGVSISLSAPKGAAQERLARSALRQAGYEGREVSYVEAHATGTVMGDAIEIGALKAAFTSNRPEAFPLVVGTVKTSLGHMEGASGMAQLIKAILVLQHREAPANLHLKEVNPKLKLEGVPVTLPTRRTPLSSYCSDGSTLLAGVNSYGVGGVHAHVILGSYGDMRPEGAAEGADTPWQGFPSSQRFPLPKRATPAHDCVGPASAPPPARDALSQLRGTLSVQSPEDRHGTLLELLKAVVLKCVDADMPPLDDNVPLMEAGLDSMALEEVRNRLHTDLGVTVTTDVLFEHPSIAALAGWLDGEVMGTGGTRGLARELSPTSTWPHLAVVGMACRFPGGVTSPEGFWNMLCTGLDCISTAPADRWGGGSKEWRGGFIEGVHLFDNTFFGISSAEAQSMDPNQRVLLEVAFEALHRAGYDRSSLRKSKTGTFIGCAGSDWLQARVNQGAASERDGVYAASGASMSNLANRVSYTLGLNGPSSTVDTACSSSLVALDSASNSLRLGKCDAAVVGGVNLLLSEAPFKLLSSGGFLSLDGRCKTFDKSANGYVRGEGCGAIVLKRLDDALADNDEVLAVLRGSAVNHNGPSVRMTAPNPGAQKELIADALIDAGLYPNDVSLIEAHGTGTSLGDPIEMSALRGVFAHDRDEAKPLIVGALKTNIGHLEGAAGIAGFIKAVLMAQHKTAPPNLHLTEQNPELDTEGFAVVLPSSLTPLPTNSNGSVVIGVSSFGFGGTNAHAVLSSYEPKAGEDGGEGLLQQHEHQSNKIAPVAFLFTGQGSQYVGMGRELYEREGVFRECVQRCSRLLMERAWLDKSVVELMYPAVAEEEEEESAQALLKETRYCQPCLFVLEYALCELWKSEGVEPSMVMGHSLGEVVAACVAGVMSLEDGLMLSARRGAIMQACPEGDGVMFAVKAGRVATLAGIVAARLAGEVVLASSNGPSASVISGARCAVDNVVEKLTADGVGCKALEVSHAFHSPLMEPAVRALEEVLRQVSFSAPRIPLVSNVSGEVVKAEEMTQATYWVQHMLSPVLFAEGIHTLVGHWMGDGRGANLSIVEVGPNPVLSSMGAKCERREGLAWISSLTRGKSSEDSFGAALGRVAGPEHLKLYPTRRPFPWYKPPLAFMPNGEMVQEGDGKRLASPFSPHLKDLLKDHAVNNVVIIPGVTYIEVGVVAALGGRQIGVEQQVVLQGASFVVPLEIEGFQQAGTDQVQSRHTMICAGMSALHAADGCMQFFGGATGDKGTTARMKYVSVMERSTPRASLHVESIRARVGEQDVSSELYKHFADAGFQYGPRFQRTRHMYGGDGEVLSVVCAMDEELCEPWEMKGFALHPAVLDNATHSIMQALPRKLLKEGGGSPFLPAGFDEVVVSASMTGKSVWVHTKLSEVQSVADSVKFDIRIADFDSKEVLVEMRGFRVQRAKGFVRVSPVRRAVYALEWQAAEPSSQEEAPNSDTDSTEAAAPQKWLVLIPQDEGGEGETAVIAVIRRCVPENVDVHSRYGGMDASWDDGALLLGEDEWARVLYVLIPRAGEAGAEGGQQARAAYALMALLRSLSTASSVPLTVLTRGVQSGEDWRHSWVTGLVRTARMECPSMRIGVVDLNDKESLDSELALGLAFPPSTEDVWVRDEQCWTPQLAHPALTLPFSLELKARGSIANAFLLRDDVIVGKHRPLHPTGSYVEVGVRAVGLNFRDVLNVLDMYPGDPGDPCSEFAGQVISVGGSSRFRVGDAVFGFADGGCLRSHMTTSDVCLAAMPAVLSFEQAAALPTVFLTVMKALDGLKAGEKVLIHAASGGVGLAAVQYAQRVGAEVYATAGAAVKHDFLRSLGVEHITSSRDAEAFKQSMGEVKVDVVLNSLSEDYIPFSLDMLSEGGIFVELGKRGVWSHEQMRSARPGVRYELLALDSTVESDFVACEPGWISGGLQRLADDCMFGNVKPLPTIPFDMRGDTQKAMVYMSKAKHIGKVVLTNPSYGVPVASDGTYVISGGLGALGLVTAQHLASRGARHLVLLSRSGKAAESMTEQWQQLQKILDLSIHTPTCDVADAEALRACLGAVLPHLPPVRGVVHAAGVLDDKLLGEQTAESVMKVFRPKAQGAVNLHELALAWAREEERASSLDFFVCFTSMAGVLGNAGQANYAAANAAVDGLMRHRRRLGLVGTSLQWGPWADVGMAAQLDIVQKQLELAGVGMVSTELGMSAFDAVTMPSASLGDVAVLPGMDWGKFADSLGASHCPSLLSGLVSAAAAAAAGASDNTALSNEVREELLGLSAGDRKRVVSLAVMEIAKECIGEGAEELNDTTPLMEAGLDSLATVEMRTRLQSRFGVDVTSDVLFSYPTVATLAAWVEDEVLSHGVAGHDGNREGAPQQSVHAGLEEEQSLHQTRGAHTAESQRRRRGLAVVGMACRFPGGADDPAAFWGNIVDRVDCASRLPFQGWGEETSGLHGGLLDDVESFDNVLFGISSGEASSMDPNQRLMLQVAYEALAEAGFAGFARGDAEREKYDGKRQDKYAMKGSDTGVFIGVSGSDWATVQTDSAQKPDAYTLGGTSASLVAGRISNRLGLVGPSLTLDTACSSSLVALEAACDKLRLGKCKTAVVGGVNLLLHPQGFVTLRKAGLLSKKGRTASFAAGADGYVRAEGCGALVLKRLSDAEADHDNILAVIEGCAVNHNGQSAQMTAPNGVAQREVMRRALRDANRLACEVGYVEAHGTGTLLGDSIEMGALHGVYAEEDQRDNGERIYPLCVGAVKTSVGHMEGASGLGQLIKAILVLQHQQTPPNLHGEHLSPELGYIEQSRIALCSQLTTFKTPVDWKGSSSSSEDGGGARARAGTLIAAVHSYGVGGTNAHIILSNWGALAMATTGGSAGEGRTGGKKTTARPPLVFMCSARYQPRDSPHRGRMVIESEEDMHEKAVDACLEIAGIFQMERQQQQQMREGRAVSPLEEADLEAQLQAVGMDTSISRTTSFLELGMDSLALVQLVNTLQDQFELQEELPLAEVLQNPTAEGLATLVVEQRHRDLIPGGGKGKQSHGEGAAAHEGVIEEKEPLLCAKMMSSVGFKVTQVVLIAVLLAQVFACMIPAYRYLRWLEADPDIETSVWVGKDLSHLANPESSYASPGGVVGWGPLVSFSIILWFLTYSASIVCVKWLVMGKYFEATVPIHASYYHRWWYVNACINVWEVGGGFLTLGTPGITMFYKLLGADVSWRCSISTFLREFDLITIGAGASVTGSLCPRSFTPSSMVFRSIVVGAGAEVEAGVVVYGGVKVGEGTRIARLSVVYPLTRIPSGDGVWEGNPAQRKQSCRSAEEEDERAVMTDTERDFAKGSGGWAKEALQLLQGVARMVLIMASVMLAAFFSWMPAVAYTFIGVSRDFRYAGVMSTVFGVYGALLTLALYLVLLKWVIAPSCLLRPGVYTDNFGRALRRWYLGKLHSQVSGYVLVFARWRLFDWWGKALGVRLGRGAINSSDGAYNPETAHLITLGDDAFASYAAFTTDEPLRRGSANIGSATAGSAGGATRVRGTCTVGDGALLGYMCVMGPGAAIPAQQGVEMFTAVAAGDTVVSTSWGQGAVVGGGREDAASSAALSGPGALTNGDIERWAAFVARETWGTLLWLATHVGSLVVVVEVGRHLNQSVGKKRGMSFEAMLPLYGAVCGCAGALALTLLLVASKWLLVGDFSRGADPITGACMSSQNISRSARTQYFRLLTRMRLFFLLYILTPLFSGTWLYNLYVRASCARPKDISLEALVLGADVHDFDFLTLEAGAILDMGSIVWGHVLRPGAAGADSTTGLLIMSPCRVKAGAVLHPYACVTHGTVGSRAELFAYSPPLMGQGLRDGGKYGGRGVPGLLKSKLS